MKKFVILITVAVIAISLVAGCVGEVKTYIDSGQTIDIGVNQEFVIAIGANPTTGYDWEVSLDETMLELVEKTYKLAEEAEHEIVGAGGVDYFRFKALKAGQAEITMVYKRSWEEPTAQDETKVFTVNIE
ncbi:MAG: protease inhibitor I42 family protein [Chloroflexi bacterium]|nr:protease inhibitor I42 family protein [Chloroflexota bacterium]